MYTLWTTTKVTNTKHGVCTIEQNPDLRTLIRDALELWHEDDNNPRLQYIDDDKDVVHATLIGARGSNLVYVTIVGPGAVRVETWKVVRVVHDGKVIHQSITEER